MTETKKLPIDAKNILLDQSTLLKTARLETFKSPRSIGNFRAFPEGKYVNKLIHWCVWLIQALHSKHIVNPVVFCFGFSLGKFIDGNLYVLNQLFESFRAKNHVRWWNYEVIKVYLIRKAHSGSNYAHQFFNTDYQRWCHGYRYRYISSACIQLCNSLT